MATTDQDAHTICFFVKAHYPIAEDETPVLFMAKMCQLFDQIDNPDVIKVSDSFYHKFIAPDPDRLSDFNTQKPLISQTVQELETGMNQLAIVQEEPAHTGVRLIAYEKRKKEKSVAETGSPFQSQLRNRIQTNNMPEMANSDLTKKLVKVYSQLGIQLPSLF